MKRLIFLTVFLGLLNFVQSQDATIIYKNTVNSTVTIETDNGFGSGFFVGENIIATNYHVMKDASRAVCYSNNSTTKYKIDGILASDITSDLILLKVNGLNKPSLKLAKSLVSPGQKVFVIGSPKGLPATISDGIVSGLREFENRSLIQITAPISPGSSGGPVLNANGELVGISVGQYTDGQNLNFAIPTSNLETLLKKKNNYPISIGSIDNYKTNSASNSNYNSQFKRPKENEKDKVYKMGVFRSGDKSLSLDYLSNVGEYSTFYFTYKHQNANQLSQTIWMEKYSLVDLETNTVYYATNTDLPKKNNPRIVYNGTETRFIVCFDRLPSSVKRFNLQEGDCSGNSFCFSKINLNNYLPATELDLDLYKNAANEGTVTFYINDKINGQLDIYIEGYHVGKITEYFKSSNYVPECGDNTNASLTVRLPAGRYNFTAKSNDLNWKGEVEISSNGCVRQGFAGK